MRRPLALLAVCLAAAAPSRAQEAGTDARSDQPTYPSQVEQVVVDVVVVDGKGRPVTGLSAADLVVREDGVPQAIVSFEAVELPEEPTAADRAPERPPVSTNLTADVRRGRAFAVLFDTMNLTPHRTLEARAAVATFLEEGVRDGDYVTLISTGDATWWTAQMPGGRARLLEIVKGLEGRHVPDLSRERITDWEAMRMHVFRDPMVYESVLRRFQTYGVLAQVERTPETTLYGGADDPYITARAAEVYQKVQSRARATLAVLERAIDGLATARGRKSVILVSEGFVQDENLPGYRRIREASLRANAAVYFLDAGGLTGLPASFTAQFGEPQQLRDIGFAMGERFEEAAGAESVASETGGFSVRHTNDLSSGIQRIADETRAYYLLGYLPTNVARDGSFREIAVELRTPGKHHVRARRGYYAPSDAPASDGDEAPSGVDPALQAALDSPWNEDGVPLRTTAYVAEEASPGKAAVTVVTDVDIRDFRLEQADGRYTGSLEFLLVVAHAESGEFFQYTQTVDMRMRPETLARIGESWLSLARLFELRPGVHQARIVVRDGADGALGSLTHEFLVPALDEFRVSTPILSDAVTDAGGGPEPVLVARRSFAQGSELVCKFDVFGAARDERGMPRVVQGFEVRRLDGSVYASGPESEIGPTSLGELSRMIGVILDEAAPGEYEIVLILRDELSGRRLEQREPFRVLSREASVVGGVG